MKDFRELLLETDDSLKAKDICKRGLEFDCLSEYRRLKAIPVGNFHMSIQGSYSHYCSPRETTDIYNYRAMEIAIFEGEEWINPNTDDRFKAFSRLEELLDRYEDGMYPVGGYVDIDLIQDLCNFLENL